MRGAYVVDQPEIGTWAVSTGRTTLSAVYVDRRMHPVVEQSGVLAFYEAPRESGGGGKRVAPDPWIAFAPGEWNTLSRVDRVVS